MISFFFLIIIFGVTLSSNESVKFSRRRGGSRNMAKVYPQYVVGIGHWSIISEGYIHKCMGTLLTQTWIISAKHCFR